jgi:flagellar biogenesis protein FliO
MELARQYLSILLVFALLAALVWRTRCGGWRWPAFKGAGRQGQGPLEVVARVALTPQHAVHLVRCEGRDLLVATHAQGCSRLIDARAEEENR